VQLLVLQAQDSWARQTVRRGNCTGSASSDCHAIYGVAAPSSHRRHPAETPWDDGRQHAQRNRRRREGLRQAERQRGSAEMSLFGKIEFLTGSDTRRAVTSWQDRSLRRSHPAFRSVSRRAPPRRMVHAVQDFSTVHAEPSGCEFYHSNSPATIPCRPKLLPDPGSQARRSARPGRCIGSASSGSPALCAAPGPSSHHWHPAGKPWAGGSRHAQNYRS
jgi:hypothetical protein